MNIEVIERNYDVGTRLHSLIEKKINRLDKYFENPSKARVVCAMEGKKFKIEVTIKNVSSTFRSETYGENMFENIDVALIKIEKQIVRHADKKKDKFVNHYIEKEEFEYLYEKPVQLAKQVAKTKIFELEPLLVEDAKQALEDVGHDFYVFLNAETGKVNVLYNRKDGEYGLIVCEY